MSCLLHIGRMGFFYKRVIFFVKNLKTKKTKRYSNRTGKIVFLLNFYEKYNKYSISWKTKNG